MRPRSIFQSDLLHYNQKHHKTHFLIYNSHKTHSFFFLMFFRCISLPFSAIKSANYLLVLVQLFAPLSTYCKPRWVAAQTKTEASDTDFFDEEHSWQDSGKRRVRGEHRHCFLFFIFYFWQTGERSGKREKRQAGRKWILGGKSAGRRWEACAGAGGKVKRNENEVGERRGAGRVEEWEEKVRGGENKRRAGRKSGRESSDGRSFESWRTLPLFQPQG